MKLLSCSSLLVSVLALSVSWNASAETSGLIPITKDMIRFNYYPFSGNRVGEPDPFSCTHKLVDELAGDWGVECVDEFGNEKKFRVHLILRTITRNPLPKMSWELLYWVTEYSERRPMTNGVSLWFHFNEVAGLHSISAGQSIEKDTAGLYLTLTAAAQ